MNEPIEVARGSGNIFADLGLPNPEEEMAKAKLVRAIAERIVRRRLTQREAARLIGIDQPKVSALIRGKWGGYSMERLIRFLSALGSNVEIRVSERHDGEFGETTVVGVLPRRGRPVLKGAGTCAKTLPRAGLTHRGRRTAAPGYTISRSPKTEKPILRRAHVKVGGRKNP